jgi:hypothetical protein
LLPEEIGEAEAAETQPGLAEELAAGLEEIAFEKGIHEGSGQ